MNFSRIISYLLVLLMPAAAFSQQYGFRNFSLKDGLPQSEIQGFIQDSKGIIWAGTNGGGLVRFDGRSFKIFNTKDGLPDNIIYSLCEDGNGNIWIGSMNAIVKYDGYTFQVYREDNAPTFRAYNQIFADQDDRIWAVSLDDPPSLRLVTITGDKIMSVSDQFPELEGNINNILFSRAGIIYISTPGPLFELKGMVNLESSILNEYEELQGRFIIPRSQTPDGGLLISSFGSNSPEQHFHLYMNGVLSMMPASDNPWFRGVNLIFKDSQSRFWFGNFGNGVAMYDPVQENISYFRQKNGLISDFIVGFMEDHEGNIWMGSRGSGLVKYSHNNFISFNFDNYIEGNMVRDIYQDSKGILWFGMAGAGLVSYDGEEFTAFSKNEFPGINNIRGMTELRPGLMMLASINGLYHFDGRSMTNVSDRYGLPQNMAFVDLLHDADTIWLSSLNLGLAKIVNGVAETFSAQSGHLLSNFYNGIMKDSKGNIWFCSNNGVGSYRNGEFDWLTVEEGLSYPITLQMTEDKSGRLWIATYMDGINIYDGENFKYLTTDNGLNSNNIYSISCDSTGDIWAGTSKGVNRILLDSSGDITGIESFGLYDGFTGIECNGTAVFIDNEEKIWFGTIEGAMRYDPHEIQPNLSEPMVHITEVNLFFKDVDWAGEDYSKYHNGVNPWFGTPSGLVFPHDSNHFTFKFEATSYQVPEKVRYQWKLEGLDKDWSPVSEKKDAVYANIPPGEYTFVVRAMNNDGIWNSVPSTFSFEIRSSLWGTWYFIVILALMVLAGITIFFRIRIRIIQSKREELERIVEEKTHEARTQNKQLEQQKEEIIAQAERLQTSYNNLENLSEIGKVITSQLSIEKIIDTVYDTINNLMDATVFGIGIVNKENNSIDFPGIKEKGKTLDSLSFSLDDKLRLSSYCVKARKEIFINDFEKDYSKFLPAITPAGSETGNSSSIIYLPLIIDNATRGVITVQSFDKNAYTEYHLNILRNLAVYTRIAIENAFAYNKIELQSEDLKSANKDISNQKQKIEETNKELIDLNKEKNHLIGIVAHDLRNPLTTSLTIAETLKVKNDKAGQEKKESLNYLVNSLNRMNDMISKILDIRMIEQKKINVQCEKKDLGEIIQDVYQNMQEIAQNKNISLNLDNKNIYGIVDSNYLTQVFENLLSNAIKFSPENSNVWISVKDNNGQVLVSFKDEGPGIRANEMDKLFGKYQRLSARPTGGEDSTGLGLSIVKKYVDVMGGKVWCESETGKGANFIVSFRKSN